MATYTVDVDGTLSYASMNAAMVAMVAAADTAGVIQVASSAGSPDTTAVSDSGAAAPCTVEPYDSTGKAGTSWNNSNYRLSVASGGYALNIAVGAIINNIQVEYTYLDTSRATIAISANSTVKASHVRLTYNTGNAGYNIYSSGSITTYLLNNVIVNASAGNQSVIYAAGTSYIVNNTVVMTVSNTNNRYGINIPAGSTSTVENNAVYAAALTACYNFAGTVTSDYNAGIDTSDTGTHSLQSLSLADFGFTNYSSGDYSITTGSLLIDAGTNTSSYGVTTDIVGTARPQGTAYDIGAFEYLSISGGNVGTVTAQATPSAVAGFVGNVVATSGQDAIAAYVGKIGGVNSSLATQGYVGIVDAISQVVGVSASTGSIGQIVGSATLKAIAGFLGTAIGTALVTGVPSGVSTVINYSPLVLDGLLFDETLVVAMSELGYPPQKFIDLHRMGFIVDETLIEALIDLYGINPSVFKINQNGLLPDETLVRILNRLAGKS